MLFGTLYFVLHRGGVGARKRIFRRFFTARCATKSITRPRPSNEEQSQ